ncbi:uncharacterized protein KD926_002750 [Aspergillus affinis]|uniref:uncharacterized protein n=1 Tax=Aspergillus affinis TaxID=1070780 RepID=UPI0022FDD88B|nr:uncharacterized protein KD926_002750 [Aspergillus affinis]KAI9043859.1 hypothetical protein KD926_002750 [Aspergillus affinis]
MPYLRLPLNWRGSRKTRRPSRHAFPIAPPLSGVKRSPSAEEEDRFYDLLRRTGAKWWPSRDDQMEAELGTRELTEEEKKVVVFSWPTDVVGVWVLRFVSKWDWPDDFGRLRLAMNMEKIQIMRQYGATFVEDVIRVEELYPGHHENDQDISTHSCM